MLVQALQEHVVLGGRQQIDQGAEFAESDRLKVASIQSCKDLLCLCPLQLGVLDKRLFLNHVFVAQLCLVFFPVRVIAQRTTIIEPILLRLQGLCLSLDDQGDYLGEFKLINLDHEIGLEWVLHPAPCRQHH